jgi:hypothetical protein
MVISPEALTLARVSEAWAKAPVVAAEAMASASSCYFMGISPVGKLSM